MTDTFDFSEGFLDGITTLELPGGLHHRAAVVYPALRRDEAVEIAGIGKFSVLHYQLRLPPPGDQGKPSMSLVLKACSDPEAEVRAYYEAVTE